jgi:hypothetical protein
VQVAAREASAIDEAAGAKPAGTAGAEHIGVESGVGESPIPRVVLLDPRPR